LFVKTVEVGSFSELGRQLQMAPSSISRQINALEEELGVRLLQRTTRHISLTEAGQIYYARVNKILHDLDEAQLAITELQANPRGTLRLNVAIPFAEKVIVPMLPRFLSMYPDLKVDLSLEDRTVDLIEERVDLAIRISKLADSSIVARKLAENHFVVCGSPQYFEANGIPKKPSDLLNYNCLTNKNVHHGNMWNFQKNSVSEGVTIAGNFQANTGSALYKAILSHLGIAALPTWFVGEDIENGDLQKILGEYEVNLPAMTDSAVYALYPAGQYLPRKVRVFIDYLIENLSP